MQHFKCEIQQHLKRLVGYLWMLQYNLKQKILEFILFHLRVNFYFFNLLLARGLFWLKDYTTHQAALKLNHEGLKCWRKKRPQPLLLLPVFWGWLRNFSFLIYLLLYIYYIHIIIFIVHYIYIYIHNIKKIIFIYYYISNGYLLKS